MKYEMIDCPECKDSYKMPKPYNCGCPACVRVYSEWKYKQKCTTCASTGTIKSDYLIITDPVEAVLFLGKQVQFVNPDNDKWTDLLYSISEDGCEDEYKNNAEKIKVHKSIVKEVCEPKEKESVFMFNNEDSLGFPGMYGIEYTSLCKPPYDVHIAVNALTINKTVGQLKELLEWMEE